MAAHIIEILRDVDGKPVPYNPIARVQWVLVDGARRVPLFCDTAADIDASIARLHEQLDEADRRRDEEEKQRPRRYSKLRLYAAIAEAGFWNALEAWLKTQDVNGVNAWVAFSLAQDLTSDHPLFTQFLSEAQATFGVDGETVARVLSAAELQDGE